MIAMTEPRAVLSARSAVIVIVLSATMAQPRSTLASTLPGEAGIDSGRHAVGGHLSVHGYDVAPERLDTRAKPSPVSPAVDLFYNFRFPNVALGANLSASRPAGAAFASADVVLPLGAVDIAAGLGYGVAFLWKDDHGVGRLGSHLSAQARVALNVYPSVDIGMGLALHLDRFGRDPELTIVSGQVRFLCRYRF